MKIQFVVALVALTFGALAHSAPYNVTCNQVLNGNVNGSAQYTLGANATRIITIQSAQNSVFTGVDIATPMLGDTNPMSPFQPGFSAEPNLPSNNQIVILGNLNDTAEALDATLQSYSEINEGRQEFGARQTLHLDKSSMIVTYKGEIKDGGKFSFAPWVTRIFITARCSQN